MQRLFLPSTVSLLAMLATAACSPTQPPAGSPGTQQTTDGAEAFDAARLYTAHWKLVEATAADGQRIDGLFPRAERPLQLDFADGRVSVANACNHIGGGYTLDGNSLSVGSLVMTQMACPDNALMQSDAEIRQRLEAGGTLHFDGDATLVYTTTAGDTLRFSGEPTADTRYGGPGERLFLEVAAQRVPCSHPLIANYQCLQVREITYDDQGLKQHEGPWQNFYENIEGYEHQPGVRNVLRLKRYTIVNPPADAPSAAYVLDMVVESDATGR